MRDAYAGFFQGLFRSPVFCDIHPAMTYLVVDVETTSASVTDGHVMQLGYCLVAGDSIDLSGQLLLHLSDDIEIHPKAAAAHGITRERCNTDGIDRRRGLESLFDLIVACGRHGHPIVGHNIIKFDWKILSLEAWRHGLSLDCGRLYSFLDTGMMTKACQMHAPAPDAEPALPIPGETRLDYFTRIGNYRRSIYWNLEYARKLFELDANCDPVRQHLRMHDALTDCLVTHCLLETFIDVGQCIDSAI